LPKSVHLKVKKSTRDVIVHISYLLKSEKIIVLQQIGSIEISKNIFYDFIVFNTIDSVYKMSFGITLSENKLVGNKIADYLGVEIFEH
jgi:hypothetical protein